MKKSKNKCLKAMIPYCIIHSGGLFSFVKDVKQKNWKEMQRILSGSTDEFNRIMEGF